MKTSELLPKPCDMHVVVYAIDITCNEEPEDIIEFADGRSASYTFKTLARNREKK